MPIYQEQALRELVEAKIGALESRDFLTRPEHKRLREMWCASRFLTGYTNRLGAASVAIEDVDEQRDYDFHFIVAGDELPFQVVEVLDAGRRRGDELRRMSRTEMDEHHRMLPLQSVKYGVEQVRNELERKVRKRYAGADQLHILVYLNLNVAGFSWDSMQEAAAPAAQTFASVWAVAQDIFVCAHGGRWWPDERAWRPID